MTCVASSHQRSAVSTRSFFQLLVLPVNALAKTIGYWVRT
jgi:hypothetical protein